MRRLLFGCLLIGFAVGLSIAPPCSAKETIEVTDTVGREVTIPKDPERIICIAPRASLVSKRFDNPYPMAFLEKASRITAKYTKQVRIRM